MSGTRVPGAAQRGQERAIAFALVLDAVLLVLYTIAAMAAGSLTMAAELLRGTLMTIIELSALLVMRRIHRGRTAILEFGSAKLEQLVNLVIAAGLLAGALWIAIAAVEKLIADENGGTPAGYALGAVAAAINLYANVLAWDAVRRAARGADSLLMQGQLQARVVKLVSSAGVQVSMTVAALAHDAAVIVWADSLGALFVCGFVVHAAVGMIRAGLPDLVDVAVTEDVQAAINRMLIRHFDDYERLDRVRTRRTGQMVHAEITVGFRGDLPMADVLRRIEAMKATLRNDVGEADVSIICAGS